MSTTFRRTLREILTENLSYKLVSLFIAMILWVTILGRRDFISTQNIDIEVRVAKNMVVAAQSPEQLRVRVSGPRSALKRFMDTAADRSLVVSLMGRGPGEYDIDVPVSQLDVPLGVKILSVRPGVVRVELKSKE
jgi:YbbR domain-containing protein